MTSLSHNVITQLKPKTTTINQASSLQPVLIYQGATGETGETGATGETGDVGAKGESGDDNTEEGAVGEKGEKGEPGENPWYIIPELPVSKFESFCKILARYSPL